MTIFGDFLENRFKAYIDFSSLLIDFVMFICHSSPSSNNHRLASVTNTARLYPEFSEGLIALSTT